MKKIPTRKKKKFDDRLTGENHYRILLHNAPDYAYVMMDKKGVIALLSESAEKILGYKSEEVVGKPFAIFFCKEDLENNVPEKEIVEAKKNGRTENERWHVRKDGSNFWGGGLVMPLYDKNVHIGFSKFFRDETQAKESENRRNDFIAIASHELRTPVTAIKLYAEMIKYKNDEIVDLTARLNAEAERTNRMIKELLNIRKIESGNLSLSLSSFVIDTLVSEMIESIKTLMDGHTFEYVGSGKRKVYGDRTHIGQVISNLLSNAMKFSPKGSVISVRTTQNADSTIVSVKDSGKGMSKKQSARIFEPLVQTGTGGMRDKSGLGLGLHVAKTIILEHGGEIWFKSEVGKGTTFFFSLPKKRRS